MGDLYSISMAVWHMLRECYFFIPILQKQQGQLKQLLEDSSSQQSQQTMATHLQLQQMAMKSQQDSNVVEQLKAIAVQKEAQVKTLEMELQSLRGAAVCWGSELR